MPNPILIRKLLAMACTPIDQLLTTDLIAQLTDAQVQAIISGRLQQRVVEYTSLGANTYNKPSDLVFAFVVCIGGGGGGGSGRKNTSGVNRTGGGGGASGGLARRYLPASAIGNTETITIGTGGTGATGVTTDTTNGNAGTAGGSTSFGTLVIANGGNGGNGGIQSTTSAGGTAVAITGLTPSQFPLSIGNTAGGAGTNGSPTDAIATSFSDRLGNNGGGGAGSSTTNISGSGSNGSRSYDRTSTLSGIVPGGSGAGGNGSNGANNVSLQLSFDYVSGVPLNTIGFGTSGGAGAANATGGNGGNAGTSGNYGAGGSGGGASTNDGGILASGNGANGAQGCCIVFEYYV